MITVIQTRTAALQFLGTAAGGGFVDFTDLPLPSNSPDIVPIITTIALENRRAESITTVDCFFVNPTEPIATTTERITVRDLNAGSEGFSLAGCRIPVPRFVAGVPGVFTPWPLILVTTGKGLIASFVVSYQLGKAVESG